jgi:diacylglycerol kinase
MINVFFRLSRRLLRRFPPSLKGLRRAAQTDFSFQTQLWGGGISFGIVYFLAAPLSSTELLFLLLGLALIFITELQNSSVEVALDHLHPDKHDRVGYSKDLAAAAVFTAGVFYAAVLTIILLSRWL